MMIVLLFVFCCVSRSLNQTPPTSTGCSPPHPPRQLSPLVSLPPKEAVVPLPCNDCVIYLLIDVHGSHASPLPKEARQPKARIPCSISSIIPVTRRSSIPTDTNVRRDPPVRIVNVTQLSSIFPKPYAGLRWWQITQLRQVDDISRKPLRELWSWTQKA
jgi:hypothetical protein